MKNQGDYSDQKVECFCCRFFLTALHYITLLFPIVTSLDYDQIHFWLVKYPAGTTMLQPVASKTQPQSTDPLEFRRLRYY